MREFTASTLKTKNKNKAKQNKVPLYLLKYKENAVLHKGGISTEQQIIATIRKQVKVRADLKKSFPYSMSIYR